MSQPQTIAGTLHYQPQAALLTVQPAAPPEDRDGPPIT